MIRNFFAFTLLVFSLWLLTLLSPREILSQGALVCVPPGNIIGACMSLPNPACWDQLRIDLFACGPDIFGTTCVPSLFIGNPNCEPCQVAGCQTTTNPCGTADSCDCMRDVHGNCLDPLDCGWNGATCGGPYCPACPNRSCCGPGLPTPTPIPTNTPVPTPSCTCTGWVDQGCGQGGCGPLDMYQTQTCNPPACQPESQCVPNHPSCVPACTVDLWPDSTNTTVGGNVLYTADVTITQGVVGVDRVEFSSSNPGVASVSPLFDNDDSDGYHTVATGTGVGGPEVITAKVFMGSGLMLPVERCSESAQIRVDPTVCPVPVWAGGSPTTVCTNGEYSTTWQWNAVWDQDVGNWAAQYQIQVDESNPPTAPYFADTGWTSSAVFGCAAGGVCSYTSINHVSETTYYARVRTQGTCTPSVWSAIDSATQTCYWCDIDLWKDSVSRPVLETETFTVNFPSGNPIPSLLDVDRVDFISSNGDNVSLCDDATPTCLVGQALYSDGSFSYRVNATGYTIGSLETITAEMFMGGLPVPICSDISTFDVTNPTGWWQVKEGDVMTAGDIISNIPPLSCDLDPLCEPVLITDDPGVPVFGGTIYPEPGGSLPNVSSKDWNVDSGISVSGLSYSFFEDRIPSSVTVSEILTPTIPGLLFAASPAYQWYKHNGPSLTITAPMNIPVDKYVILFVDGNLIIDGNITLTDGRGLFMAIVSGDITISPTVGGAVGSGPHLEGVYYAQGTFRTAVSNLQLHARGSVAAHSVSLGRSLDDNSNNPAEIFEYGLDQIFLFPQSLTPQNLIWREVAP